MSVGLAGTAVKSLIKESIQRKTLKYHVPMCLPESHPMFETDTGVLEELLVLILSDIHLNINITIFGAHSWF